MLHDYRLTCTDFIEWLTVVVRFDAGQEPIGEDIQELRIGDGGIAKGGPIFDEVVPALRRIPNDGCTRTCGVEEVTPGILPVGLGADGLGERDFGVGTAFEELDIEDIRGIGDITTRDRAIESAAKAGDRGSTCCGESPAGDIGNSVGRAI
jgi:hypothetical protein